MKLKLSLSVILLQNLFLLSQGLKYSQTCKESSSMSFCLNPIYLSWLAGLRLSEELRGEGGWELQLDPAGPDPGGGGRWGPGRLDRILPQHDLADLADGGRGVAVHLVAHHGRGRPPQPPHHRHRPPLDHGRQQPRGLHARPGGQLWLQPPDSRRHGHGSRGGGRLSLPNP